MSRGAGKGSNGDGPAGGPVVESRLRESRGQGSLDLPESPQPATDQWVDAGDDPAVGDP